MWRLACILVLLLQPYTGIAQFDLASRIFQNVHESLENAGAFGGFNSFQPFNDDLGQRIFQNVHDSLRGTSNLGNIIFDNVHRQLAPLQNLGLRIHNQVSQSLAPVRAMGIKNNMMNGVGGTTVATYYGIRPRSFIIKNGFRRICRNGPVIGTTCRGYLEPFDIQTREDFCYAKSYASVNNRICLSSGYVNMDYYNGRLTCESSDGSPTLMLSMREYAQLCGNRMPWEVSYRYYANPRDPMAIRIPNPNPYVVCQNNQPGVCDFEADAGGSGTVIQSGSGFNYHSFN